MLNTSNEWRLSQNMNGGVIVGCCGSGLGTSLAWSSQFSGYCFDLIVLRVGKKESKSINGDQALSG